MFRTRYLLSPSGSLLFVLSVQIRILPSSLEDVATESSACEKKMKIAFLTKFTFICLALWIRSRIISRFKDDDSDSCDRIFCHFIFV